jgi:hypothetical protein
MSDKQIIHTGQMNSWENPGKLDIGVRVEILGNSRVVMYFTDENDMVREATVELDGENAERLILMVHGPYNANNPEMGPGNPDEPLFIAKAGSDRAFVYTNNSRNDGRPDFAMVSETGVELANTMEFPETVIAPKM